MELNYISKDKTLQKRAKEKIYYDKTKDENNKFNIVTKQMLVEQNYEYLNKFGRKITRINKNENKQKNENENKDKYEDENINDKKENDEDDKINSNGKEKEKDNNINDMTDNREKKLINLHINKIKLIYKQK